MTELTGISAYGPEGSLEGVGGGGAEELEGVGVSSPSTYQTGVSGSQSISNLRLMMRMIPTLIRVAGSASPELCSDALPSVV